MNYEKIMGCNLYNIDENDEVFPLMIYTCYIHETYTVAIETEVWSRVDYLLRHAPCVISTVTVVCTIIQLVYPNM